MLHWPAISFFKIISKDFFDLTIKGFLLIFLLATSYTIYKYIETPIRKRGSNTVAYLQLALIGLLGIFGYSGYSSILKPYINYTLIGSEKITQAFNDWKYPTKSMNTFIYNGTNF